MYASTSGLTASKNVIWSVSEYLVVDVSTTSPSQSLKSSDSVDWVFTTPSSEMQPRHL